MPDRLTRKYFLPGAQIFREGEPGDEAYIIVSGEVEISALQRGRKIVIDKLREEELLGEMALIDYPDHAANAFRKLKNEGVRLAIDDFGTGYSSLSYLNRYPLDTLKIDRSFVANMMKDKSSLNIVRGIAGLASDLGMNIIAKCIESTDEVTQLRDFGCSYGQGYLISHPVPFDDAGALLKSRLSW